MAVDWSFKKDHDLYALQEQYKASLLFKAADDFDKEYIQNIVKSKRNDIQGWLNKLENHEADPTKTEIPELNFEAQKAKLLEHVAIIKQAAQELAIDDQGMKSVIEEAKGKLFDHFDPHQEHFLAVRDHGKEKNEITQKKFDSLKSHFEELKEQVYNWIEALSKYKELHPKFAELREFVDDVDKLVVAGDARVAEKVEKQTEKVDKDITDTSDPKDLKVSEPIPTPPAVPTPAPAAPTASAAEPSSEPSEEETPAEEEVKPAADDSEEYKDHEIIDGKIGKQLRVKKNGKVYISAEFLESDGWEISLTSTKHLRVTKNGHTEEFGLFNNPKTKTLEFKLDDDINKYVLASPDSIEHLFKKDDSAETEEEVTLKVGGEEYEFSRLGNELNKDSLVFPDAEEDKESPEDPFSEGDVVYALIADDKRFVKDLALKSVVQKVSGTRKDSEPFMISVKTFEGNNYTIPIDMVGIPENIKAVLIDSPEGGRESEETTSAEEKIGFFVIDLEIEKMRERPFEAYKSTIPSTDVIPLPSLSEENPEQPSFAEGDMLYFNIGFNSPSIPGVIPLTSAKFISMGEPFDITGSGKSYNIDVEYKNLLQEEVQVTVPCRYVFIPDLSKDVLIDGIAEAEEIEPVVATEEPEADESSDADTTAAGPSSETGSEAEGESTDEKFKVLGITQTEFEELVKPGEVINKKGIKELVNELYDKVPSYDSLMKIKLDVGTFDLADDSIFKADTEIKRKEAEKVALIVYLVQNGLITLDDDAKAQFKSFMEGKEHEEGMLYLGNIFARVHIALFA